MSGTARVCAARVSLLLLLSIASRVVGRAHWHDCDRPRFGREPAERPKQVPHGEAVPAPRFASGESEAADVTTPGDNRRRALQTAEVVA
jgi:hypothetical protein